MFTLQKRSSYVVIFMLLFRYVASVNQTWDSEYKIYCTSVRHHVFTPQKRDVFSTNKSAFSI